jgi:hypothetical protein
VGSAGSSAAGPPPFWIALAELPVASLGANNGVFVIPANALSSTPLSVSPATTNATLLATASQIVTNSDGTTTSRPAVAMYYATGSDSKVHIYGINLAASTIPPAATQIGSFAMDSSSGNQVCLSDSAQIDQSNPQTLFVIIEIATACGNPGGTFEQVNFTDTPTVAPIPLPYWSGTTQALYTVNGMNSVALIESTGSALIFASSPANGGVTVSTLPLTVSSPQPSVLWNMPGGYLTGAFLDSSSAYLYVNYTSSQENLTPGTAAISLANGQQLRASVNSMFVQAGSDALLLSGVATIHNVGGGTISRFDPMTATQNPLTLANGSVYTLPPGAGSVTASLNDGVGIINVGAETVGALPAIGALYAASTNVIVPLGPANTDVSVW